MGNEKNNEIHEITKNNHIKKLYKRNSVSTRSNRNWEDDIVNCPKVIKVDKWIECAENKKRQNEK